MTPVTFAYAYMSSVYFLWWDAYEGLWLIFSLASVFPYYWASRLLCLFWITNLYPMCVLKFFFSPLACLLSFLTLSFAEQTFLVLIKSSSSIISFVSYLKKSLPHPMPCRFAPLLSLRVNSIIAFYTSVCDPFCLNFSKRYKIRSRLFCVRMWMSCCSSNICWKTIFFPSYCCCSFAKYQLILFI